ncbi:hypothetical protein MMC30_004964 [Trapelia coarctata]|nr:hypothetical protein [Trapelia coarctata]
MMEEVKVPMETAEGSLLPDQITAGTKVAGELNQMVDEMIEELEHKLGAVSAEIMAKMDDMSRRLDNLEASIHAQNNQAANPS